MPPLSEEQISDFQRFPAVGDSSSNEVYLLKNDAVIGVGYIGSRSLGRVTVYLDRSPELLAYFAEDELVKILGKDAPFGFHAVLGTPVNTLVDEDPDRLDGISIVDKWSFDYGYTSERYAHIEGFGAKRLAEPK